MKSNFNVAELEAKGFKKGEDGTWRRTGKAKALTKNILSEVAPGGNEIFIPYDVRSSKNGRRAKTAWTKKGQKYSAIIPSEAVDKYVSLTKFAYSGGREKFLKMVKDKPKPYYVGFRFARATLGRWDFHNMVQIVCDLMTKNEWIEDDDVNNLIPVYIPHHKDKNNPGVYISVL